MKKYSLNDIVAPLMESATDKELLELINNAIDRLDKPESIKKLKKEINEIYEYEFAKPS